VERLAELTDGFVPQREAGEHPAASRIGQRAKRHIEMIFNHTVY
jgi:hypothetical protein